MSKARLRRVAALALALSIPLTALPAANAAPDTDTQDPSTLGAITEADQWQQTLLQEARDLEASSIPRHTVTHDGEDFLVYELNTGIELAMPAHLTQPSPRLSAGPSIMGPWIELTPTEQKTIAGGTTGFITAAICYGSFGLACASAGALTGAAMSYIGDKGVCPNNKRLLIELNWGGGPIRGATCR